MGVSIANAPELEKRLPSTSEDVATMRKTLADAELSLSDQDPSLVRLGDASIASPFTSKRATIECVLSHRVSRPLHAREHDPDLQDSGRVMSRVGVHAVVVVFARCQARNEWKSNFGHPASMTVRFGILTAALFFLTSRANRERIPRRCRRNGRRGCV